MNRFDRPCNASGGPLSANTRGESARHDGLLRLNCLQHVSFEGPGRIATWAQERGHQFTPTALWADEPLPNLDDFDWLVILGGPMSVHEESRYTWMRPEKVLIERALRIGKPVLGICLGAQMIADVLGARVYPNEFKEVGWFPVRRTAESAASVVFAQLPQQFTAFHWHGETFDLPRGARHLAETDACPHQAFEYGSALAIQCHLEVTRPAVQSLICNCRDDIGRGRYEQSEAEMLAAVGDFRAAEGHLFKLLDTMAAQTGREARDHATADAQRCQRYRRAKPIGGQGGS